MHSGRGNVVDFQNNFAEQMNSVSNEEASFIRPMCPLLAAATPVEVFTVDSFTVLRSWSPTVPVEMDGHT
jgi:hypothetical protein